MIPGGAARRSTTGSGRVLLIGMMGAGKTTVGHETSLLLGWRFIDNDELLETVMGKPTRKVLEDDGEQVLRRAESRCLGLILDEGTPLVAGVAGGVVTDPLARARLRSAGLVVWLRASVGLLARRIAGTDRPWLGASPLLAIEHLYLGRAELYASVANTIIDIDDLEPREIARRIAAHVGA